MGQVFLAGIALTMAINYWSSEAWARDPTRRKVLLVAVVGLCLAQVGCVFFASSLPPLGFGKSVGLTGSCGSLRLS